MTLCAHNVWINIDKTGYGGISENLTSGLIQNGRHSLSLKSLQKACVMGYCNEYKTPLFM
jgi:hypothetical protein